MSGWRQAVFLRQRLDVIQRALSEVLDEESWSPATPRRLYIGGADASSRGWTMIAPELADFFLDRGGRPEPRLARLARALRCPGYEVDVRDPDAIALCEVDERGRIRLSGARRPAAPGEDDPRASPVVSFGLVAITDEIAGRIAALAGGRASVLADYLGAIVGFPAWTHSADDPVTAGELVYEPPRIVAGARFAAASPHHSPRRLGRSTPARGGKRREAVGAHARKRSEDSTRRG